MVRTLLVLGRVSNLPTVWSNVLCAWLITGQSDWLDFFLICLGVSCIYVGGMYLNDVCDSHFDKEHNPERPIPSGQINRKTVLVLSVGWFVFGVVSLGLLMQWQTVLWGLGLLGVVVLYDVVHKKTSLGLVLMGGCRFLLYPLVGSVDGRALDEAILITGIGMFLYIVALSSAARSVHSSKGLKYLTFVLMAISVGSVFVDGANSYHLTFIVAALMLVLWIIRSFAFLFWVQKSDIGRAVEGLLVGIVLLDLVKVSSLSGVEVSWLAVFLGLFFMSLLAQRRIPAN